jgi:hypothetical protein
MIVIWVIIEDFIRFIQGLRSVFPVVAVQPIMLNHEYDVEDNTQEAKPEFDGVSIQRGPIRAIVTYKNRL